MSEHTQAQPAEDLGMRLVNYIKPSLTGPRGMTILNVSDIMTVIVQSLSDGARQGLHAHEAYDGFYYVLGGRARFYGRDGKIFADVEAGQGVFVPRGTPYGFEAIGGEAQLLSIDAIDKRIDDVFTSHEQGSDVVDYDFYGQDGTPQEARRWSAGDGILQA